MYKSTWEIDLGVCLVLQGRVSLVALRSLADNKKRSYNKQDVMRDMQVG